MTKVTQAHIDARTEDILDAARRMFVRKGVDCATMQEIASEAGISAGAIYRYYPSKAELLRAVCGDWVEKDQLLFEQVVGNGSPLQGLLQVGRAVWDEMQDPGAREDTMLALETILTAARSASELEAERREAMLGVAAKIERFIAGAQAAGELDTAIDARALAVVLLACSFGTRVLALELGDEIDTEPVLAVLGLILSRLAPQGV